MVRLTNSALNWLLWCIGLCLPKGRPGRGICIIRNDLIGDFILFIPALRQFRKGYPESKITIIVKPSVAPLLRSCPYVDSVIVLDEVSFRRRPFYRVRFLRQVYSREFSKAIYGCYSRNYIGDLVSLWTAAPVRVAWSSDCNHMSIAENIRGNLSYTRLIRGEFAPMIHEITRNGALLTALGAGLTDTPLGQPEFWLDMQAEAEAASLLRDHHLEGKRFVAVLPGASFPLKNWGARGYRELCRALLAEGGFGLELVLCGQVEDALDLARSDFEFADRVVDLRGKTTLPVLAGIFKQSALVVGNDTGTMHIAIAVNAPTVCIVGGGHFGRFMPYGSSERHVFLSHPLPCYHCNWNCIYGHAVCISEISINMVLEACKKFV